MTIMWKIFKALPKSWRQKVCSPLGSSQYADDPSLDCSSIGGINEPNIQDASDVEKCQNLVTSDDKFTEVNPTETQLAIDDKVKIRCPVTRYLYHYCTQQHPKYAWFSKWLEHRRNDVEECLQKPCLFEAFCVGITLLVERKYELLHHFSKYHHQRCHMRLPGLRLRSVSFRNGLHLSHSVLPHSAIGGICAGTQLQTSTTTAEWTETIPPERTEDALLANLEQITNEYTSHVLNAEAKKLANREEFRKAVQLFKAADDLGLAEAKYNLGVCYELGLGLELNLTKAFQYYKEAADLGHGGALYNLAVFHLEGRELPVDKMQGLECMAKASDCGIKEAHTFMGIHYGQQAEFAKAVDLLKRAADLKDPNGQYYLGVCYENGLGVEENAAAALELYEKAALEGSTDACYRLATCFEQGLGGLTEDKMRATELYLKAATDGHELAKERLKWSMSEEESSDSDNYVIFKDSKAGSMNEMTGQTLRMTKSSPELMQRNFSGSETVALPPRNQTVKLDFSLIKELFKYFKEGMASPKMAHLPAIDNNDYLSESDHDTMKLALTNRRQTPLSWNDSHSVTAV